MHDTAAGPSTARTPAHARALALGGVAYLFAVAVPLLITTGIQRNFGLWPATAVGISLLFRTELANRAVTIMVITIANALAIAMFGQGPWASVPALLAAHLLGELGTVWLVERTVGRPVDVERLSHLAAFASLASMVTLPLAAVVGSFHFAAASPLPKMRDVFNWWLPEATLTLLLVPALLQSFQFGRAEPAGWSHRQLERVAIIVLFALVLASAFTPFVVRLGQWPVVVATSPLLIWAALRVGIGMTAWLVTALAAIGVIATVLGVGPFVVFSQKPFLQVLAAETYALVIGLSAIFLAAAQAQRRRADLAEATALTSLARSAARFTTFFRTTRDPITLVDEHGTVVAISPAAVELLTERAGAVRAPQQHGAIADSIAWLPTALRAPMAKGWARALAGVATTEQLEVAPGQEIGVEWYPLRDDRGETIGASASMIDVSRQRAEAAEMERTRRLETVGRLAGGIAHDFNNILTIVLGNLDLLDASLDANDPRRKDFNEVRAAANRAVDLTQQLLSYARRRVVAPRHVDLSIHVAGLESLLRRLLGADVQLRSQLAAPGPVVRIDPAQLDQIVMNLVVNARDAMPDGGELRVRVEATALDAHDAQRKRLPPGAYAVLTVMDCGVGMPPDVLSRILEPFFTTKGTGEGTGLGLATVDGIARQNGGSVDVESTVGEGSVFRVYFPLASAPADILLENRSTITAVPHGRQRVILVCEDEASIRTLLMRSLTAHGYRVLAASNVPEALAIAESQQIDLLFSDVVLPGSSGVVLADTLFRQQPSLRVVLMSGYAEELLTKPTTGAFPYRFLQKPFDAAQLLVVLEQALQEREHTDSPP